MSNIKGYKNEVLQLIASRKLNGWKIVSIQVKNIMGIYQRIFLWHSFLSKLVTMLFTPA